MPVRVVLAVMVLTLGNGAPAASVLGVETDRAGYPLPPAPQLPPAGGTFTDPTFGTTILCLTDQRDGKHNHIAYSYWPTFNQNSTRLIIHCDEGAFTYKFDLDGFKASDKEPVFAKPTPAGSTVRWEDSTWSGQDPDAIFAEDGSRLWRYDSTSRRFTLIKDLKKEFGCGIGQMSGNIDDRVFALSTNDGRGHSGCLVWQRDSDQVLLRLKGFDLDEVQLDKSGRWPLIKTNRQGQGVVQDKVADLKTGKVEDLIDDASDYAPGHSDYGTGFCIGAENWKNRFLRREFKTSHQFVVILDRKDDWTQEAHVSLLSDDERWCVISFYEDKPAARPSPFHGEIVQVATDGSQRVCRLAHHRTVTHGDYWNIPLANISGDGRFIAFNSNFAGSCQCDVFILCFPALPEQ